MPRLQYSLRYSDISIGVFFIVCLSYDHACIISYRIRLFVYHVLLFLWSCSAFISLGLWCIAGFPFIAKIAYHYSYRAFSSNVKENYDISESRVFAELCHSVIFTDFSMNFQSSQHFILCIRYKNCNFSVLVVLLWCGVSSEVAEKPAWFSLKANWQLNGTLTMFFYPIVVQFIRHIA